MTWIKGRYYGKDTISTINGRLYLSAINHIVVSCLFGNRWTLHFSATMENTKDIEDIKDMTDMRERNEGMKKGWMVNENCVVLGRRVNQNDQLKMVNVQGVLVIC